MVYADGELTGGSGVVEPRWPATLLSLDVYPNPIATGAPATDNQIRFSLSAASMVSLHVHTVSGRLIRTLATTQVLAAGRHCLHWDARGAHGSPLPSGSYFYRLEIDGHILSRKVVLFE